MQGLSLFDTLVWHHIGLYNICMYTDINQVKLCAQQSTVYTGFCSYVMFTKFNLCLHEFVHDYTFI